MGQVMRTLDSTEIEKLAQLNRVKLLATLVLVACFVVLIAAKLLEHQYPAFSVVAAFAEAATIGGIADWYAVVALFKKPMNLPIPHTAIISNNQGRIADNLGRFIKNNFLARGPVEQKLQDIDFAGEISQWLSTRSRSEGLARFVVRFLPQLLQAVDEKGLVQFATQRVTGQIEKVDIAPLLGNVMQTFTRNGRHQKLLDDLISALHNFLNDEATVEVVRAKIKSELPVLFNVLGADKLLLNRIIRAATELLNEIESDSDHPMRIEFEDFLLAYIDRTRQTKGFATQVEQMKQHILSRPEIEDAAEHLWSGFKDFILNDIEANESQLIARLTDMLMEIGSSLVEEPVLRQDINKGMVSVISNLVEEQRDGISTYVSEQVRGWDMQQLLLLIEVNVGRDLQYIRFNGMIIGGCVGVALFAIESLLL
jgi:uncharacterized membrane-anchored protein YjiN (DUF445 family)